jgi:hypothetical protein
MDHQGKNAREKKILVDGKHLHKNNSLSPTRKILVDDKHPTFL